MKKWFKARYEVFLIRTARRLLNRNFKRSAVISRRDNKKIDAIGENLEFIESRILNRYER